MFGDIYLDEHREWVERVCHDLEITPIEPLWNIPAEKILREFLDLGFTAIVVSCKADILGKKYVGRIVDYRFLEELKEKRFVFVVKMGSSIPLWLMVHVSRRK